MRQIFDLDPVALRYAAALRGVVPPPQETLFHYVRQGNMDTALALGLAASNPEGRFSFIVPEPAARQGAQRRQQALRLKNCAFVTSEEAAALRDVQFFCADLTADSDRDGASQAAALAAGLLAEGGIFACRYAPFPAGTDGLRFMVAEFAPELSADQYGEFLQELQQLGQRYLAGHPSMAAALDQAMMGQAAPDFLRRHGLGSPSVSATVRMIAAMVPQGFGFVGDACIQANYLEMMVPTEAQPLLGALRGHLLYEAIKDFATARESRSDIWVRQPASFSGDMAELFGTFFFGLADGVQTGQPLVALHGRTLDMTPPVFQAWLALLRRMPLTIGDFLDHAQGGEFTPQDAVMAIHALVAFGVAAPMRGSFGGLGRVNYAYPRLAGAFNQQLQVKDLDSAAVMLASPVAGRPVEITLPEALVLQAATRVGLAESADALMPELQRLAQDPVLATQVFVNQADLAPAFAETMIKNICQDRMVNWYALGILDAA